MFASIPRVTTTVALTLILVGCAAGAGPASPSASTTLVATPTDQPPPTPSPSVPTATPASPSPSATPEPTPEPTPVPVPPKPTGVRFDTETRSIDDGDFGEVTQTVTWRVPRSEGVEIRVYGVTECIAEPSNPPPGSSGPCLVVQTPLPASVRRLLATAPASDGAVSWTWTEEGGCDPTPLKSAPDGPAYHALVLAAYGPSGHSIFAIAEPGGWWRPGLGDIVC